MLYVWLVASMKIKSSVEMKDTATSAVKVTYYSKCLDENGPLKQTNKCDGLRVGTVVTFQAEIEVKTCPKDPKEWNHVFQIYPVGINESLTVDLEMLCSCPCERPGNPGKDILEFSVVGVTKSKLAARSLYEPARCFGVNIDPVFPNSVFEYRRILVAERGLKWKARLAGGSGGILHSYES
ncbi:Integrin beta-1 [Homalodisca vitripennis]|nr:Integrin beta-1 [Homalodisca vitripennis]